MARHTFLALIAVTLAAWTGASAAASADLQVAVRQAGLGAPEWLVYAIEADDDQDFVCCHRLVGGSVEQATCNPETRRDSWSVSDDRRSIPRSTLLDVYLGVERGKVTRVRAYSQGCRVEVSWPLRRLDDVGQTDSLALLTDLALQRRGDDDRHDHDDGLDHVLGAMARHRAPASVQALGELSAPGLGRDLRKAALFWLGQTESQQAVAILARRLDDEPSAELREHVLFSLSQTGRPEAADRIRRAAEQDVSTQVRAQGWFWLAQTGDGRTEAAIFSALATERSRHVREQAVFALSQLPDGRAVDALLRVLRTSGDGGMQRQALLWLAETEDPRALELLSDLLAR